MKKHKFSNLLLYRKKYASLFNELNLRLSPHSRINQYFDFLEKKEQTRIKQPQEFSKLINSNRAKYYYSQFYTGELQSIFDALEANPQNSQILKDKLSDLAKGTYLLSEENISDTSARNTSFELLLFSYLHERGAEVFLRDPNPDLEVITSNFVYDVECKRPSSEKTVEKNIRKALKQIRKRKLVSDNVPVIALSLDKVLLNDDLVYHSKNEETSLLGLERLLLNYLKHNRYTLSKVLGNTPCVVLYYLSCLAGFDDTSLPMSNATYMIGNVYEFEPELSQKIFNDLNTFRKKL